MFNYNELIKQASPLMVDAYNFLHSNPELGYHEWKGHGYMKNAFLSLGYKVDEFGDIPGFTATFDTGRVGKTIGLFAELDGMINHSHPDCDKVTGAVHACGHDFQCANVLGVAYILKNACTTDMSGRVKFVIVPAEEGVEILERYELVKQGLIKYTSGKPEIIYRGILDDVDIGYQNHIGVNTKGIAVYRPGENGLIRKSIVIQGKSAHAGANPYDGINALYVANVIMTAINALRETFKESDYVRVHPIITKGGDAVNTIPGEVTMESYVRGATVDVIKQVNEKVNRAIVGGALSMGANVRILDLPGSMPVTNSIPLAEVAREASYLAYDDVRFESSWVTSSTDMGDVSCIMPTIMAKVEGARGSLHGADYVVDDIKSTCEKSCIQQAELIRRLLIDDCKEAKRVIKDTPVPFKSKEEYLEFIDGFNIDKQMIDYTDGIKINL